MELAINFVVLLSGVAAMGQSTRPSTPATLPAIPRDVKYEPDISYLSEDRKEKADLYSPAGRSASEPLPAVIVMHGGGFNDGDKARSREVNICTTLAQNGYVCLSINYKLAKVKDKATWPQSVFDAKTAVQWLRNNSTKLGIDPDRIAAFGCSAGGNLAAMLAFTRPEDGFEPPDSNLVSTGIRCAIDFYGAVDLINYHDMKMFAKTREEAPELYRKASPLTYVRKDVAPLLMVHGTDDKTVPLSQSQTLAAAMEKAGAEFQLVVVQDAPHTFNLQPKQKDLRPIVLEFLDKHLKY